MTIAITQTDKFLHSHQHVSSSALRGAGLPVTANQMEGWRFLTQQQLSVITHCSTTLRWLCPSPRVQSCCLVLLISVHGLQWFYELIGGNDEA